MIFSVCDDYGRPLPGVTLRIGDQDGRILAERRTYADGRAMFFTAEDPRYRSRQLVVDAVYQGRGVSIPFSSFGRRTIGIRFPVVRETPARVPLDVLFLLDTTGSMSDEISRLKSTMEVINYQIGQLPTRPDVRFGMVEYRDRGDEYLTRVTPFMWDVESFRGKLREVKANGGGDTPEDLQEGLRQAMYGVQWRDEAVKVVFLVADAPPHLDYQDETYTYVDAMRDAAGRGIKIVAVGASGLDDGGEYIFRQLAQYTMGEFVFLTYGERGESGPGTPASVSHHTGANYQVRSLDAIIVNIVRKELSHFGAQDYAVEEEYFETVADESRAGESERILGEFLNRGLKQLLDYSSVWIEAATPAALMPVAAADGVTRRKAEVLEDKLLIKLFDLKQFNLVERRDLLQVLEEKNISAEEVFDSEKSARIGNLLGARVMIIPRLSAGPEKLELLVKMVRVETGEILSVSLMKLDTWLI